MMLKFSSQLAEVKLIWHVSVSLNPNISRIRNLYQDFPNPTDPFNSLATHEKAYICRP
jgi:hypothetical protein